jgi:hypothetical protein
MNCTSRRAMPCAAISTNSSRALFRWSRQPSGDVMKAHRTRVRVSQEHEIRIALPSDFPPGEAEVTVVGVEPQNDSHRKLTVDELIAGRLPRPAGVGPVSLADMERAIEAGAIGRDGI